MNVGIMVVPMAVEQRLSAVNLASTNGYLPKLAAKHRSLIT